MCWRLIAVKRCLIKHLHFIVVVPTLIIAVTWPVFPNLFDGDSYWLPSQNHDIFMKLWDAWYGMMLLGGKADFYFTDLHFHPGGLSLDFHNFSLPHMLVFGALQRIVAVDTAYSLTHLLTIFANALSAYLVLLAWFRDRWVALAGALVFGLHPYLIHHSPHPDVINLFTVPPSLYALHRGIVARRKAWLAISAALLGITAFVGMYIFVCLLITIGIYTMWLASKYGSSRWFWSYVAVFLCLAAAISMIRIYPMLGDSHGLDEALNKGSVASRSSDLLEYIANPRHPHLGPLFAAAFGGLTKHNHSGHSYIGFVFLVVAGYALVASSCRRRLYPWVAALLFFMVLRLGDTLIVNGHSYDDIRLPDFYLKAWFRWLFGAFWDVEHYLIGLIFPSAVVFAYGLKQISARLAPRRLAAAILSIAIVCAYEGYSPQRAGLTIPQSRLDFIHWLAQEPNQDEIHIINLPIGRKPSKVYGYYQTLSGYPQAEGLASRTPENAYRYIDDNLLLRSWRSTKPVRCLPNAKEDFSQDLRRLQADGFTHIVLHHDLVDLHSLPRSFDHVPAAYSDDTVAIYRLDDIHATCDSTALLNPSAASLPDLLDIGLAIPDRSAAVLSIHDSELAGGPMLDYYSVLNHAGNNLLPLRLEDSPARDTPLSVSPDVDPAAVLAAKQIVVFAFDPRHAGPNLVSSYRTWVAREFRSCGALVSRGALQVELFLPRDFPCDLIDSEGARVNFDSGHRLGKLMWQQDKDALDLHFRWDRIPWQKHSISIQVFNVDGDKVFNQDFVIRLKSLAHHRVDLSALAPGDYQARLIVYDYETHASVPGEMVGSGARFERELEIGEFVVE